MRSKLPTINLSRDPFRNRRLFWLCWSVLFVVLLIAAQSVWKRRQDKLGEIQQAREHNVRKQNRLAELRRARSKHETPILTPNQERSMETALLLVGRRTFSWSRMLTQLEIETPRQVKITQISFAKTGDGENGRENKEEKTNPDQFPLSLAVEAASPEIITKYLLDMEKHGVFHFDPKKISRGKEDNLGQVKFDLEGWYRISAPDLTPAKEVADEDADKPLSKPPSVRVNGARTPPKRKPL